MTNKAQSMLRSAAATLVLALLAACASERQALPPAPSSPTTSVAQADERLAAVAAERAAIAANYAAREAVCYDKFFVNNCLDEAKERRRSAEAVQRAIEIDAEHFKRKFKVEQRDRQMVEAEARYREEEARAATQPPAAPKVPTAVPPPRPSPVAGRMARHDQKAQEDAAKEAADAPKRAANAAAYEERRRKSEERQRLVAQRKAEREAKRVKAEQEKAAGQQPAPAQ